MVHGKMELSKAPQYLRTFTIGVKGVVPDGAIVISCSGQFNNDYRSMSIPLQMDIFPQAQHIILVRSHIRKHHTNNEHGPNGLDIKLRSKRTWSKATDTIFLF